MSITNSQLFASNPLTNDIRIVHDDLIKDLSSMQAAGITGGAAAPASSNPSSGLPTELYIVGGFAQIGIKVATGIDIGWPLNLNPFKLPDPSLPPL